MVRAVREVTGRETVVGGTQSGDGVVVDEEAGDAAAGQRLRLRTRRGEAEVPHGQADVPAAVGVGFHLDADRGCALLVHLAVVPAFPVRVLEDLAHR